MRGIGRPNALKGLLSGTTEYCLKGQIYDLIRSARLRRVPVDCARRDRNQRASRRPVSKGGVVTIESAHDVATTVDRLEDAVEGAGAKVFARVDHSAGAANVDLELRPTQMLMFGNPKLGTPALQAGQTIGMDLPLRVVAWEDETGKVMLS